MRNWKYGDPDRRKDNWTLITTEERKRIGRKFKDRHGRHYYFFGIVDGYDDYYYGMNSRKYGMVLLSCVGSIEGCGFKEIPSQSIEDDMRQLYDKKINKTGKG